MIIGIDAMGGDAAPQTVIDAVREIEKSQLQLTEDNKFDIVLIGDKAQLSGKVADSKIIHAPTVVGMKEHPAEAFKKKDSSIAIGTQLLSQGKIDAFVGAGNTGVYVMFGVLELGRIKGVRRPALGIFIPSKSGATFVLDVGANATVKTEDLYQFGAMGTLCVEGITGKKSPSVSILSVGEEEAKGSPTTKEAYQLMQSSGLNFLGNIEGHQILDGISDVVVCDGFVGNVLLKFAEGIVEFITSLIKNTISSSLLTKFGGLLIRNTLKKQFAVMRYQKYGGALLLGVKGVTVICHGRSNPEAICNAVYTAARYVKSGVNERIEQYFSTNNQTPITA
ncbi:MAG: phosphate acyltransferase PlsX [Candidatus Stahlbacteria bacterium]|nr:phosphate acyltransferase PlsX [Candidatus Stahlbacteria bacterium]